MANSPLIANLTKPDVSTVAGPASTASTLAGAAGAADVAAPDITTEFPEIRPLVDGEVAAVYTPRGFTQSKRANELAKRVPDLQAAGLDFYLPKTDKTVAIVTFNPSIIGRDQIAKADAAKTITKDFPSASDFFQDVPSPEDKRSTEPSTSPIAVRPPSSDAQRKAAGVKVANMRPQQPSERVQPGAGPLYNSLL